MVPILCKRLNFYPATTSKILKKKALTSFCITMLSQDLLTGAIKKWIEVAEEQIIQQLTKLKDNVQFILPQKSCIKIL